MIKHYFCFGVMRMARRERERTRQVIVNIYEFIAIVYGLTSFAAFDCADPETAPLFAST